MHLDLESVLLGLDVSVTIQSGIAFEDIVARVVRVERINSTHEDGGLDSVEQLVLCQSYVPLHLRLCNDLCIVGSVSGSDGGGGGLIRDISKSLYMHRDLRQLSHTFAPRTRLIDVGKLESRPVFQGGDLGDHGICEP